MSHPAKRPCSERLSNLEWESHIKSWEESSLSKAEYFRQENISCYAFNYWQRRLKPPSQFSPITMVKLEEIQSVPPSFEP